MITLFQATCSLFVVLCIPYVSKELSYHIDFLNRKCIFFIYILLAGEFITRLAYIFAWYFNIPVFSERWINAWFIS